LKTDNTFNFDQTCVLDIFAILFFFIMELFSIFQSKIKQSY